MMFRGLCSPSLDFAIKKDKKITKKTKYYFPFFLTSSPVISAMNKVNQV
jgi:hypothetical protein